MQTFRTAPPSPEATGPLPTGRSVPPGNLADRGSARLRRLRQAPPRSVHARRLERAADAAGFEACRTRRHAALLERLVAAEQALAKAAAAVEALRQVAELGPHASASLAIEGGGR